MSTHIGINLSVMYASHAANNMESYTLTDNEVRTIQLLTYALDHGGNGGDLVALALSAGMDTERLAIFANHPVFEPWKNDDSFRTSLLLRHHPNIYGSGYDPSLIPSIALQQPQQPGGWLNISS